MYVIDKCVHVKKPNSGAMTIKLDNRYILLSSGYINVVIEIRVGSNANFQNTTLSFITPRWCIIE